MIITFAIIELDFNKYNFKSHPTTKLLALRLSARFGRVRLNLYLPVIIMYYVSI